LSAQSNLGVLCKRLLAVLSVAVAATLAASAPGLNRWGLQSAAKPDRVVVSGLKGLIEDEEPQHPDAAAGDPRSKAGSAVAHRTLAPAPSRTARPPLKTAGAPATHAVRAGLTRAPPPA
jgi:hypothetical protein